MAVCDGEHSQGAAVLTQFQDGRLGAVSTVSHGSDIGIPRNIAPENVPEPRYLTLKEMGLKRKILAFVALTKPRIIELLLTTTIPTMIFAAKGFPPLWLIFATLVGGTMAASSANAFNCYFDRDIDRLMHRTEKRPLVTGEVTPRQAWIFSWTLGVLSVVWLGFVVNWLSAILGAVAIFFYVVIYTLLLKRRTAQNIVWGGAAGCMPVLIGWSAVTNELSAAPWILFGIIFFWTPPHYWPLSMKYRDDYENASVPMLSVVRGSQTVAVQVVLYAYAMVVCSLLLIPVGDAGIVYTVTALATGIWFIVESHQLYSLSLKNDGPITPKAMRVFHGSVIYLTILFIALAVDPFVTIPGM